MEKKSCADDIQTEDYLERTEEKYLAQINAQKKEIEDLQNIILQQKQTLWHLFSAMDTNRKQLGLM